MRTAFKVSSAGLARGGSALALAVALTFSGAAMAQTDEDNSEDAIVVTGTRIAAAGFDQPTPTTVIGDTELRQAARANLQQALNDQPQFRATVSSQVSNGNTATGTAPVDLRGLGSARTLTLVNGRRFAGENNLNFVPVSMVERLEVVTGGASAAYGSGAVAGVVNIILKDKMDGFSLNVNNGISSRGDGYRYGVDAGFGKNFADGRGNFMVGVEYLNDKGIYDRNSRKQLGSSAIVRVNPLSTTDLSTALTHDVNYGNMSSAGLITTGVLAGKTFNADGSLRDWRGGTMLGSAQFGSQMIGGEDGVGLYDDVSVSTPFSRFNSYARLSFDVGGAKLWVDGTYGRVRTNARFLPDFTIGALTIDATNPYLSQSIQNQLSESDETSFTFGRVFNDAFMMGFDSTRVNKEVAVGVDGRFGNGFKYSAYYTHGEVETKQYLTNARIADRFTNSLNAVSSGGNIVCAINADGNTANDDPSCRPFNPFGSYNYSPEALDYVTGTQGSTGVSKLDAVGAELQGSLFSLWAAEPITVAVGAEARWESQASHRTAETLEYGWGLPLFTSDLTGGFNVKEAFAEAALPVLDIADAVKLDLNGAARYSDYSNSGGIWSWKLGGSLRVANDLLLRATSSRDIRSPGVGDLYSVRRINVAPLVDQDTAGRTHVNYNPNPQQVTTYSGGNPDLAPETSRTWTVGGSYSPSYLKGLRLSVDYFDITMNGAIATLSASNLTLACKNGSTAACNQIVRDPVTGTVTTAYSNAQNVAVFETNGFDFEVAYSLRASDLSESFGSGSLRLRALATKINNFVYDTGITRVNTAGDVGDATANSMPKWRGVLSASYQDDHFGFDTRVRYVGGGTYNKALTTLVNNQISARTYVDLGVQGKINDRFSLYMNVANLFDVKPPISPAGNMHYDTIGTYFSGGVRVKF